MNDDVIRAFIDDHEWTFAKTMALIPHWSTLRRKANSGELFAEVAQEIRLRGVVRPFGSKSSTYLDLDGWTYSTMGVPVEETILINRARLPGKTALPG